MFILSNTAFISRNYKFDQPCFYYGHSNLTSPADLVSVFKVSQASSPLLRLSSAISPPKIYIRSPATSLLVPRCANKQTTSITLSPVVIAIQMLLCICITSSV